MNLSCSEAPQTPTKDCTEACKTGILWREGSDECKSARWAYYDCRTAVDECKAWNIGYGQGHECDQFYEDQLAACAEISSRD